MPVQVLMPSMGESVVEGTVTKWLKAVGETVAEYDALVEINTDKVDTEIPSPASGVLAKILVEPGTTVQAGTVLAHISTGESEQPASHPASSAAATSPVAALPASTQPTAPEIAQPAAHSGDLGFISPVVAKIAKERGVDLSRVTGTGSSGRITKEDVLKFLASAPAPAAAPQPATAVRPAGAPPAQPVGPEDEIIPLTPVRRAIAEHMVFSERTSPHVTTVMEADLSKVVARRLANKAAYAQNGANLTFTAYFAAAVVAALKAYPLVNSSWGDQGILVHRGIHLGIATALGDEGLIVPVIKHADGLSLLGLARAINDLANRARTHKLQPDEVRGGTFTITNHGTSGSLFATPIINQPQCAILGVGAIQKRVVVVQDGTNDAIAIRPMVYLSLTFDHRILDGLSADNFLAKVVESLQSNPS